MVLAGAGRAARCGLFFFLPSLGAALSGDWHGAPLNAAPVPAALCFLSTPPPPCPIAPLPLLPRRSFVQVPDTTAQTFRDLQAELLAAFGGAPGGASGQLLAPDDVRAALGAAPDADLQQLLLSAPGQPW